MLDRPESTHPRAGVTAVEVLVAMMLLSVGVLAVAGTTGLALRSAATTRLEREAVARAVNRAARVSSVGCREPVAGSVDEGGMTESWEVSPTSAGVAMLDIRVRWQSRAGLQIFALASAILC